MAVSFLAVFSFLVSLEVEVEAGLVSGSSLQRMVNSFSPLRTTLIAFFVILLPPRLPRLSFNEMKFYFLIVLNFATK